MVLEIQQGCLNFPVGVGGNVCHGSDRPFRVEVSGRKEWKEQTVLQHMVLLVDDLEGICRGKTTHNRRLKNSSPFKHLLRAKTAVA